MAKRLERGIELLDEVLGVGPPAERGSQVVYNARFFLRRGDEVTRDASSIALYRERLPLRVIEDVELIDHTTVLGRRQSIACVEKSLYGMREGGYREILASAHLCYGDRGVPGLIPPGAMLRVRVWVHAVRPRIWPHRSNA